ncbi:hypothetical protein FB45DRAFT_997370 [Roridomyces roridus]|uniref:Uncharacterized protein n=1 Tax=Roridomyces roridus TaxID=1738132 RepID=A0AAD7FYS9_9AGAR|nr:hypothetical protein FB45DRAFT_997370 [Roridomyces roridus]
MKVSLQELHPFGNENERTKYQDLKERAESYDDNPRNLEEHWRAVFAQRFQGISLHLPRAFVQEEITIWSFHDPKKNPSARKLAESLHLAHGSGSSLRPDFGVLAKLGIKWYLFLLAENKRAVPRSQVDPSGWPNTMHGRAALLSQMKVAVEEAELQAALLFKTDEASLDPESRQDFVVLLATVGPIYLVGRVQRAQLETELDENELSMALLSIQSNGQAGDEERELDMHGMHVDQPQIYNVYDVEDFTHQSTLPASTWHGPFILDSPESDATLLVLRNWLTDTISE